MKTSWRTMLPLGLGSLFMLAALFFQTVTLASQKYNGVLVTALVLAIVADLCLIVAFQRGRLAVRFLSGLLMLPTIFVVMDFFRRAPDSFG